MHEAKTPAQVAQAFGCTEAQARAQIEQSAKQLRADAERAKASTTGKLRGLTAGWYEDRAAAFEAVL